MKKQSEVKMPFDEFKELLAAFVVLADRHGFGCAAALRAFHAFLRTGCSERDAKCWLLIRISDFPRDLRETLVLCFASETFEEAERESVRGMTDDEVGDRFTEILKRDGSQAAEEWLRNARRP